MKIKVAFFDDHPVLLDGLVSLYSTKKDMQIVGKGYNAIEALKATEELNPDVLVLDLNMPGDTISTIEVLLRNFITTRILIFTAASSIETAIQVLNMGVSGYVLKGSTANDLYDAIRIVHGGNTYISPGFATKVILSMKTAEMRRMAGTQKRLSIREEQIVQYLMQGKTNREIADFLEISEKTVKHYMSLLMQKLDARNRVEVVLAAQKLDRPGGGAIHLN